MFELFIDNKKELQIAETPLFKSSKLLKNRFGGAKEFDVRTFKMNLSRVDFGELRELYKFVKN